MASRVVLGFSGGVDSAVCAVLLKNTGYEVLGIYLDNAGEDALEDALSAAAHIGISLEVKDVHDELEQKVCCAFQNAYLRGETPNPCIICNPLMKFKNIIEYADKTDSPFIATGHYARSENGLLYKGLPSNDQSYMLCRITRSQLDRLILPLGCYEKTQVRSMASEFGLPVANKADSMEICFIPDKDYIGWLEKRTEVPSEGPLVFQNRVIGSHRGITHYTVGQRYPGLINERKVYISKIRAEDNTIELALWEDLFKTEVTARDFNWLCDMPDIFDGSVRVRHTKWENPPCTVRKEGNLVKISCDEPVRAPAAGQSAVVYRGNQVIGGGFICG